jgi:hypothetical protein
MRKKLKYNFIFFLVIVLIVALFLSTSCEIVSIMLGRDTDSKERRKKEAQQELIKQEEKNAELRRKEEEEQATAEAELEELIFEEEEKLIPDEPITYSGDALGLAVVLVVNFKTTEVTGSIILSGDDYVDATITDGKINIDTFEITANFSGIMGSAEYGEDAPFNGTITGIISNDLSTFDGVILDDEGDGGKFTINK